MNKNLLLLIFRAVALGLGIGSLILLWMNEIGTNDALTLLAIGSICLSISAISENTAKPPNE